MRVIEYTGENRIEAPDQDHLQELADTGEYEELLTTLVRWKGWITVGDLCDNWGMKLEDVGETVNSLESDGVVESWKQDEEEIGFS